MFELFYTLCTNVNRSFRILKKFKVGKYKYTKHAKDAKLFKNPMSYLLSHCNKIKFEKSFGKNQSLARIKRIIT